MKKLFAIALAVILFAGCNKDDNEDRTATLTFENVPSDQLAGPTSYGANYYASYKEGAEGFSDKFVRVTGYYDAKTDLQWASNVSTGYPGASEEPEFGAGGIAMSNWNDMTTEGYLNQCSAYFKASNGKGGHGGSNNFGVVFGGGKVEVGFKTAATERIFDHMWVTNTTYAYLYMKNGNQSETPSLNSDPLSYENEGWFKLIITGYDASGNEKGTPVEVYLADFRETTSPGILTDWKKVDLSSLGAVHKIGFSFDGSDTNDWGVMTPTYFCFDDLQIRL